MLIGRRSSSVAHIERATAGDDRGFDHHRLRKRIERGEGQGDPTSGDGGFDDQAAARTERRSPVASIEPSATARSKKAIKRNANGDPVHSFAGLIDHLGTMTCNTMRMPLAAKHRFTLLSKSTPVQEAAFKLLGFGP